MYAVGGQENHSSRKEFEDIRLTLSELLLAPPIATESTIPDFSNQLCQIKTLCQTFESPEHPSATLYQDSDGNKLIDGRLFDIENRLKECYDTKFASMLYQDQKKSEHSLLLQSLSKAERTFQESVLKNQETEKKIQLELAISQAIESKVNEASDLNNINDDESLLIFDAQTKVKMESLLKALEDSSKVTFSEETRQKYLLFLLARSKLRKFRLDLRSRNTDKNLSYFPHEWAILHNPLSYAKPFFDSHAAGSKLKVLQNQKEFKNRMNQFTELFKATQSDVIKFLKQRRNLTNAGEIDNMIHRANTVQFKIPTLHPENLLFTTGSCSIPTAFYSPDKHAITLCPQIITYPIMSIRRTLAHEFGHSFDPCRMADPLISISNITLRTKGKTHTPEELARKKANSERYIPLIPIKRAPSASVYRVSTPDAITNLDVLYTEYKIHTEAENVLFENNPFKAAISCLSSEKSIGVVIPDTSDLERQLNQGILEKQHMGATVESSKRLRRMTEIRANMDDFRERVFCSSIPNKKGVSQVNEVFADFVAAKVLSNYIGSADPAVQKRLAFEATTPFPRACVNSTNLGFQKRATDLLKTAGCQDEAKGPLALDIEALEQLITENQAVHPLKSKRINNLFLAEPTFQKALGCTPDPEVTYCD